MTNMDSWCPLGWFLCLQPLTVGCCEWCRSFGSTGPFLRRISFSVRDWWFWALVRSDCASKTFRCYTVQALQWVKRGSWHNLVGGPLSSRWIADQKAYKWAEHEILRPPSLVTADRVPRCREVLQAVGKLTFDGTIEQLSCVIQHEDYGALTHRAVLTQVGPLLKDCNGHGYRRRAG